jgi:hypothetical protein
MVRAVIDFEPNSAVTVEAPVRMTTLYYDQGGDTPVAKQIYVATTVYASPASLEVTAHHLFIVDGRHAPATVKGYAITADGLEAIDLSDAGKRSVTLGETLASLHASTTPPGSR